MHVAEVVSEEHNQIIRKLDCQFTYTEPETILFVLEACGILQVCVYIYWNKDLPPAMNETYSIGQ